MVKFKHLDWDSAFYEMNVGRISVEHDEDLIKIKKIITEKKNQNYQLIYLFSKTPIVHFERYLMDKKVTYSCNNLDFTIIKNAALYSLNKDTPLNEKLLDLTLQSGAHSRFLLDTKLAKGSFEKMYRQWIENSLQHIIADEVIVYFDENYKGFITYKTYTDKTVIGLIAVDTTSRGKQIGTQLIDILKEKTIELGKNSIEVATQMNNVIACKFYEKNNFDIKSIEYIYHIHLK